MVNTKMFGVSMYRRLGGDKVYQIMLKKVASALAELLVVERLDEIESWAPSDTPWQRKRLAAAQLASVDVDYLTLDEIMDGVRGTTASTCAS